MSHNPVVVKNLRKQNLNLVEIPKGRGKALSSGWNRWSTEKYENEISTDNDFVVMGGDTSDGLVILDHDDSYSLDYANEIIPDILNKTLVSKSGDGTHCYLKTTGGSLRSFDLWRRDEKLEFKGQGKYVVGPSCEHWKQEDKSKPWIKTGKRYEIISNTTEIMKIDRTELMNLVIAAGWGKKNVQSYQNHKNPSDAQYGDTYYDYDDLLKGDYKQGERRIKQKSLYCKMRFRGYSEAESKDKIIEINKTCNPPLEEKEIRDNLESTEKFFRHVYVEYVENQTIARDVIELESLTDIEKSEYAGKTVKLKAVIASNSIAYNVPKEFKAKCVTDGNHMCKGQTPVNVTLTYDKMVEFVDIPSEKRNSKMTYLVKNQFTTNCKIQKNQKVTATLEKFKIRPIISSLYKKEKDFFDDEGNKWSSYDIFIENTKDILKIEAGKEVEIIGFVMADPKNQKVTLFANSINELNENNFDLEKVKDLRNLFQDKTVAEKMNWITGEFEKNSKIIKRRNVAELGFLTFFSPLYINFEGSIIPSWIKSLVIGDSTVGKSETVRKQIILLRAGQIVSGEMATVAGLAGASVQASGGQWFTDFGVLPMQDRRLLAIDGAHKLRAEELGKLAEAERNGKIEITKASKDEAYARTRQIKIMNPVDEDRSTTVSMDSFFYPVNSLQNIFHLQSIARIDIACFVSDDVSAEQRNIQSDTYFDPKLENLSELLRLVWSMKYRVEFTDQAMSEILMQSTELEKKFKTEHIPLITNDQKYKLAKISASLACLTCSFNDSFDVVTVTDEHVTYVCEFLSSEYHKAGLDELVKKTRHDKTTLETLYYVITDIGGKINENKGTSVSILQWIAETNRFTREELTEQFDLSRDNQLKPLLGYLQDKKIIKRNRSGYSVLKYGIEIGRFIVDFSNSSHSSLAKNDTPINNSKEKKEEISLLSELEELERLKIKNFRCKTCNVEWKSTSATMEEIEEQHNKGTVDSHEIEEILPNHSLAE